MQFANKSTCRALIVLGWLALMGWPAWATVTINIGAGNLKAADGSLMPTTGLAILVGSTNGVFGVPTATAFETGGNVEVARWNLSGSGTPGLLSDTTGPISIPAGLSAGDELMLYWFPTLTIGATSPSGGTAYGYYRDAVAPYGAFGGGTDGSDPWYIPGNGTSVDIYFATTDAGGGTPATNGLASYTVALPPVAGTAYWSRTSNENLMIPITTLLTNVADPAGGTVYLTGVGSPSTNGILMATNTTYVLYPGGTNNVTDSFSYTVTDSFGGTATGNVVIQMVSVTGTNSLVSLKVGVPGGGTNTLTYAGIPNYQYIVQFVTNLTTSPWFTLSTNTASANGLWTVIDLTATNAQRFYRLITP